jgi:hypothetical protein
LPIQFGPHCNTQNSRLFTKILCSLRKKITSAFWLIEREKWVGLCCNWASYSKPHHYCILEEDFMEVCHKCKKIFCCIHVCIS